MATWTDIPDEVLEPGKPIRSVDALALRDNAIAIAQGAAGAPRIQTNAIQNGAITNVKIANMDAGKLNSGTVPGARMPTTHGGVGTYAFVTTTGGSPLATNWGGTRAGSSLRVAASEDPRYAGQGFPDGSTATLSGTWRIMGAVVGIIDGAGARQYAATLAVRIS